MCQAAPIQTIAKIEPIMKKSRCRVFMVEGETATRRTLCRQSGPGPPRLPQGRIRNGHIPPTLSMAGAVPF